MSSSSPRWEYRVTELLGPSPEELGAHLTEVAAEGWDLINGSTSTPRLALGLKLGSAYTMWWRKPADATP